VIQLSDVKREAAKSGLFRWTFEIGSNYIRSKQTCAAPTVLDCCLHFHPALPGWANSFRAYGAGEIAKTIHLFTTALRLFITSAFK
jgi:hypothetical protein